MGVRTEPRRAGPDLGTGPELLARLPRGADRLADPGAEACRPGPRAAGAWGWGWGALAAVLAARVVFQERGEEWRETATILPALACLALTFGGWSLLGRVWPAITFLGFMLPLPPGSTPCCRALAAPGDLGELRLLRLSGLWVMAEGHVIVVGADRLEVAEACNGLSMLMCLAATVSAATLLLPLTSWKRAALLASILPVALLSNVLRIAATAWCYQAFGAEAGGHFAHDAAGWLMMPLALLLVGSELAVWSWLIVARPDSTSMSLAHGGGGHTGADRRPREANREFARSHQLVRIRVWNPCGSGDFRCHP